MGASVRIVTPTQKHLIAAGVKHLKEYGYPNVTAENILTDRIYSAFFKSMLEDNMGKGVDTAIKGLLDALHEANAEGQNQK